MFNVKMRSDLLTEQKLKIVPIVTPRFCCPTVSMSRANPIVQTVPPEAPCRNRASASTGIEFPTARRIVDNSSSTRPRRKGNWREEDSLSASTPAIGDAKQDAAAYIARR